MQNESLTWAAWKSMRESHEAGRDKPVAPIPMTSARIRPGLYEVIGTSTACQVQKYDVSWVLTSDGKYVDTFASKREALQYCQEHPELQVAAVNLNGIAGLYEQRRSRQTGTLIGLYDGEPAGLDTSGGRWQTVCEEHGAICSHDTYAIARSFMASPVDWCEDCSANVGFVDPHDDEYVPPAE